MRRRGRGGRDHDGGISLLTATRKGLEWPVVFLGRCPRSAGRGWGVPRCLTSRPSWCRAGPGGGGEPRRGAPPLLRGRDRAVTPRPGPCPALPALLPRRAPEPLPRRLDGAAWCPADHRGQPPPPPPAGPRGPAHRDDPSIRLRPGRFKDCARRYAYRSVYRLRCRPRPSAGTDPGPHRPPGPGGTAPERRRRRARRGGPSVGRGVGGVPSPKGAHGELRSLGESQLRRYAASPGWRDAEPLMVEQPFTLGVGAVT